VSLVGFYFLYRLAINSSYFLSRLEDTLDGDASGRGALYSNAYQIWASSSFSQFFFGHGFDATLKLMRIHAHSDWLELLVDYGVLGVAIYLALFVSLIFQVKRVEHWKINVFFLPFYIFGLCKFLNFDGLILNLG
jgi:O-Antigen ligase.